MVIVVIGSNRGIGLEFVRQYQESDHEVIAVCRNNSDSLKKLKDIENPIRIIEGIDVVNEDDLRNTARMINKDSGKIDILIHNSGIWRTENIDHMDYTTMIEQFEVNTLGPIKSVMSFLPYLKEGAKVGLLTSKMGSIADNTSGGRYGYRMSKCALNMAGKSLSIDLDPYQIKIALLHPGYVRTDMTNHNGNIFPEESVKGLIRCMEKLDMSNTGNMWHYTGDLIPW